MAAYVIVDVTIHDKEKYVEYIKQSPATVEAFGGRFVVRGVRPRYWKETGRRDGS